MNGSLNGLRKLKGSSWGGPNVIYFGDHVYADLKEPARLAGWKTGIVIKELDYEVEKQATDEYKNAVLMLREVLAESHKPEPSIPREILLGRMELIRQRLKVIFNSNFGSAFKTDTGPTLFAASVTRYADIYTSDITNLNHFPQNHVFWPPLVNLPHDLPQN